MSRPTRSTGDYEDLLRRALHSAVDPIEPADDGLERIQARLTTPDPLPVAWVVAACTEVAGRARGGLQSALAWLQSVPQRMMPSPSSPSSTAPEGYGVAPPAPSRRPRFGRARLAAVVAAITLIMAMSVSAVTPFGKLMLSQASALLNAIGGAPAVPGAGGQAPGQPGAAGTGNGQPAGTGAGAAHGTQNHAQPAANCASSTPALATPAASPSGSTSPASPSPTVSPSSTSPPPASPSPSGSSPAVSPSPTSASPASASPSSPSLARTGRAGSRRAPVSATGRSSSACASPTPRPSPTPHPSPSSPPGATVAPSSPPASPSPSSPSPSSSPAASPSPSTAGPATTAPASSNPAASSQSDMGAASGSAAPEGS